MENKRLSFFDLPEKLPNLSPDRQALYNILHSALVYIPILLGFNFIGVVTIYILGKTGLLEDSDTRLLLVGAISLLVSILHLPLYSLLRQGKLESVTLGLLIVDGIGSALQVFLWQNLALFPLIMAATPALVFAFQRGLRGSMRIFSVFFALFGIAGILFVDRNIAYERISVNSLTHMAALTVYFMVIIIMALLVFFTSTVRFRTISGRLVITFTFVVLFSAFTTLLVAALVGLFHDQQSMFRQLSAVTSLRQTQIQSVLTDLGNDLNAITDNAVVAQRMRFLIRGTSDNLLYQFNAELVRVQLEKALQENNQYQELFVMDHTGTVVITTLKINQKADFSRRSFFRRALDGASFTIEKNFPGTSGLSIIAISPILENGTAQGYLAARSSFESIKTIMESSANLGNTLETYLVGKDFLPLTNTRGGSFVRINTTATRQSIDAGLSGSSRYSNYANIEVMGHYAWLPDIEAALITEISRAEIVQGILAILITNMAIGLFTVAVTFSIIYITSRSISTPIVSLAEKATILASGELSTRMAVDRQDEIGTLASSFNTMAGELQNLVYTLEQKVEARTQDLQLQANRFRVAAEVARDTTTARSLDELLNRSAQLVLERFNFYHTGIFLIDSRREFAILRASPTEAGRQMLENKHRLKIGQVGIVGNVAASGQPRIALNTGQDDTYFKNPFLPNTRSEMGLPLKVEGEVIGVLDVQSEIAEAFTQEDVAVLQIMADQLAVSIRRVQLVQELEDTLSETRRTSQHFTTASWRNFSDTPDFKPGYRYDGTKLSPITNFPANSQEVLRRGHSIILSEGSGSDGKETLLGVPLKLRDQVIGVLNIQFTGVVSQDTLSLLEDAANRLAIALENARLYTETQKLAERERAVSDIAARITTSTNIDNILRTTVLELGRMLPNAEVTVQIQENKQ